MIKTNPRVTDKNSKCGAFELWCMIYSLKNKIKTKQINVR